MFSPWIDLAFVIDIETTGLDYWRNEILTLSVSAMQLDGYNELDKELFQFRPTRPKFFSQESEEIHGISIDQAMNFPEQRKEMKRFLNFLKAYASKPQLMVCHAKWFGKYFDSAFIDCQLFLTNEIWEKRKYIGKTVSTLTMAQSAKVQSESFSLDSLCKHYQIELKHHDADSDRNACQELFKILHSQGANDGFTNFIELSDNTDEKKKTRSKTAKIKKSDNQPSDRFLISG
jgi:DNA polymerase III alpha subunit (gram-positive type)